jgi:hypothetical protein
MPGAGNGMVSTGSDPLGAEQRTISNFRHAPLPASTFRSLPRLPGAPGDDNLRPPSIGTPKPAPYDRIHDIPIITVRAS